MAKLTTHEIRKVGKETILANPGGIRHSDLVKEIFESNPETPINTISRQVNRLDLDFPDDIARPARGLYAPIDGAVPSQEVKSKDDIRESAFYEPFADWLKNDLDEASDAIALGGASMGKKWGTPDVVGVYRPKASDIIKFDTEIISAELKIDPQQPVIAFGQAAVYRLFSTKSYVVMPQSMSAVDHDRIEALCMVYGIGLVLFNETDVDKPGFRIRVRAQRFSPDMFFVNEFAEQLKVTDCKKFERLFP